MLSRLRELYFDFNLALLFFNGNGTFRSHLNCEIFDPPFLSIGLVASCTQGGTPACCLAVKERNRQGPQRLSDTIEGDLATLASVRSVFNAFERRAELSLIPCFHFLQLVPFGTSRGGDPASLT